MPRRVPRRLAATVLVALASLHGVGCGGPPATSPGRLASGEPAVAGTIVEVVDGDTVVIDLGVAAESARLLGIDTPETVKPGSPVECHGPEASARTEELLAPGTDVLVQRDREARDRYGRLLVYVWRRADGAFVNEVLVAEGFARTLSIAPNTAHRRRLASAERMARTMAAGLWGSCPHVTRQR